MSKRPEPFAWNPNIGAVNGFGIKLPGIGQSCEVPASSNTICTIPSLPTSGRTQSDPYIGKNSGYAIIKYTYGVDFWVAVNADATPSLTGAFVSNASMLNPECLLVYEGDELNFYSVVGGAASVTVFPWA
jgi:hypothetical protein